ncbi:MAG: adenylate/guanylate cyclase domain-containing protein [Myxococcota bacterium]
MSSQAPVGRVVLVFTDVQGSTQLWEELPEEMRTALSMHDEVMRQLLAEHNGYEVKTEGDAFMAAFARVEDAVRWCVETQRALVLVDWPAGIASRGGLLVRAGILAGEADCRPNPLTGRMDYFGPTVNRAARVAGAAHGGQVLVEESTFQALEPLDGTVCQALGSYRFKGLREPLGLVQVVPADLADRRFGPPRTESSGDSTVVTHSGTSLDVEAAVRAAADGLLARGTVRRNRGLAHLASEDLRAACSCARLAGLAGVERRAELLLIEADGELTPPERVRRLEELRDRAEHSRDDWVAVRAALQLGSAWMTAGDLARCASTLSAARVRAEASGDPDATAAALLAEALLARRRSDLDEVAAKAQRALEVVEQAGLRRHRSSALVELARVRIWRGDPAGEPLLERALKEARQAGDAREISVAMLELASALMRRHAWNDALRWVRRSQQQARSMGWQEGVARGRLVEALSLLFLGDTEACVRLLREVDLRAIAVYGGISVAAHRLHLAAAFAQQGRNDETQCELALAREALSFAPAHPLWTMLGEVEALLRLRNGDVVGARERLSALPDRPRMLAPLLEAATAPGRGDLTRPLGTVP